MTTKADFTDEEWARLKRAPFVAGMAISLADPGGPIELVKETSAALKTVRARRGRRRGELVDALAARSWRTPGTTRTRSAASSPRAPRRRGDPRRARRGQPHRDREGDAGGRRGVRKWLLDAAQEAANAAKEGGFLGFHAERVSEGEQKMLDSLRDALSEG